MRKRLSFTTFADTSIELDVPDEVSARGDEAIEEFMVENGVFPTLCAQCTGGEFMMADYNLNLGDEWNGVRTDDGRLDIEDA